MSRSPLIPCANPLDPQIIADYADALCQAAYRIGNHGMSEQQFWSSGLFGSAVEKLRGTQAASMKNKKDFINWALQQLEENNYISSFSFTGQGDRHDYQVAMPSGKQCIFEAKGCLDGNNTTIFERPANAEEFLIWSLCQHPGSNLDHGVWSGVHTRLGGKIIAEKERVEALIVWDMLCGTPERPCPKILEGRGKEIDGKMVPPPCVYVFPRTIPDPRNNPNPTIGDITSIELASALLSFFGGNADDVINVKIRCEMRGADVFRQTLIEKNEQILCESKWTKLKRAR